MKPRVAMLTAGLIGALVTVVIVLVFTTISVDAPEEPEPTYEAQDQYDAGHEGDCTSE